MKMSLLLKMVIAGLQLGFSLPGRGSGRRQPGHL
jgi:hypothetical protein